MVNIDRNNLLNLQGISLNYPLLGSPPHKQCIMGCTATQRFKSLKDKIIVIVLK